MSDGGDLIKFKKALKAKGLVVRHEGTKHPGVYWRATGVRVATMSASPSDRCSWPNFLSDLRAATGFDYRPKQTRKPRELVSA